MRLIWIDLTTSSSFRLTRPAFDTAFDLALDESRGPYSPIESCIKGCVERYIFPIGDLGDNYLADFLFSSAFTRSRK